MEFFLLWSNVTNWDGGQGQDHDTVTVPLRMFLMVDAKAGAPGASFLSS